jgi:predicted DsbA family dithiol-disulfide isomerase
MSKASPANIFYFSDVFCIWAYAAQIKLDELRRQFGDRIRIRYRFLPLFGDVDGHIEDNWGERGGAEGYARNVKQVAARFDHLEIHPDIWTVNRPSSSASCHLFLKAIQLLQAGGEISAAHETCFDGRSLFEEAVWRCRLGFFRDLQDVGASSRQEAIADSIGLPVSGIRRQIDSGAAFAELCADYAAKEKYLVEGSPTFLLQEGRQKLYGNVGYRLIEANVEELLADRGERASWC